MPERKKFPTLEQMYSDWEAACVPADCPHDQHIEMKKAFMSGVARLFLALKATADVPDEVGADYLSQLEDQLDKFFHEDTYKL